MQNQRLLSPRTIQAQSQSSGRTSVKAEIQGGDPADDLAGYFAQARSAGFAAALTLGDAAVLAGLRRHCAAHPGFLVYPVIPNIPAFVREATEYGMAGAGMRRVLRANPRAILGAVLTGVANSPALLRNSFPARLKILYELELGDFRQFRPPAVFLHQQITDLALSFGNPLIFRQYAQCCRRRFGTEPGLVTANFVRLAEFLQEHRIEIGLICAPLNRENFLMNGQAQHYRAILGSGRFQLVADRLALTAPTPAEAIEWALAQPGVAAAAAEFSAQHAGGVG